MNSDVIELNYPIDIDRIRKEGDTIEYDDQICIQGLDKEMDPFFGARGFRGLGWTDNKGHTEFEFDTVLFDQLEYVNSIIKDLSMYRTRLFRSDSKTCLSWHHDTWNAKRIHIPVYTNEKCFMLIERTSHHLEAGKVYLTDTRKNHTAINASWEKRTHIVGVVHA